MIPAPEREGVTEPLLLSQSAEFLGLRFSKHVPGASSIIVAWELFTNRNAQAHPRPSESATIYVSISPPGDSEVS